MVRDAAWYALTHSNLVQVGIVSDSGAVLGGARVPAAKRKRRSIITMRGRQGASEAGETLIPRNR